MAGERIGERSAAIQRKRSKVRAFVICELKCGYLCAADGNLYAGVHIDFMSTDAALFRTMGGRTAIRTEQYDSRWLNGEWAQAADVNNYGSGFIRLTKSGLCSSALGPLRARVCADPADP